jgi:FKBP-type peptidyl-prolyl cis-trans isomerase 2
MSAETTHPHGATKSGELVRLEYDLWAEGGGRTDLIDTTHEEVAQQASVPVSEGAHWGPRPHMVGGEYFPGAIEAALTGAKIGEEFEREFAPGEAFGERDPKLIELFSMHEISRLPEMRREDAHLDLGTILTIEGRRGRVVTLTAARVRVDFNPPFSGRKVRAKFKVLERISDPAEQARGILELLYGRGSEFHVEIRDKTLTLRIPDRSKFDISWMAAKPRVVDRLRSQLHPETIRIVEEYVTPTPEKTEKKEDSDKSKGHAPEKQAEHEGHAHQSSKPDTKDEASEKAPEHEGHAHRPSKSDTKDEAPEKAPEHEGHAHRPSKPDTKDDAPEKGSEHEGHSHHKAEKKDTADAGSTSDSE